MYIKCINQAGSGDRIYEASDHVVLGSKHYWLENQSAPPFEAPLPELLDRLGVYGDTYDLTLIHPEPAGFKDGDKKRPFWKLAWAKFDYRGEVKLVVCSGPIYVLGDTGKTIDRA